MHLRSCLRAFAGRGRQFERGRATTKLALALAAALAAGLCAANTALAASPLGNWRTADGRAIIRIVNCAAGVCGTPVGSSTQILQMRSDGANRWSGTVFNPEDGGTYTASMTLASDTELVVRGCLLVFCQSQTWTRVR